MPTMGRLGIIVFRPPRLHGSYPTPCSPPFKRVFRPSVPNVTGQIVGGAGRRRSRNERPRKEVCLLGTKREISMARQLRSPERPLLKRVLARTRELAQEVRETSERVHQQAQEARCLTEIARRQAERGRELSEAGRAEAREVVNSIKWSIDTAGNGNRRPATKIDD